MWKVLACTTMIAGLGSARETAAGWTVDRIPWRTSAADGTRFALLEGTRDRAGAPFSYAFSIPAGVWDGPHRHSVTARVFVAKGTLHLGYGLAVGRDHAARYPAGS